MINQDLAMEIVEILRQNGVIFKDGLSDSRLERIENVLGGSIPTDLRTFLSVTTPISYHDDNLFPRWDEDMEQVIRKSESFVRELFKSDIKNDGYWSPLFFWGAANESRRRLRESLGGY